MLNQKFSCFGFRKILIYTLWLFLGLIQKPIDASEVEYERDVKPILTKYCVGCHNESDHQSEVQLQNLSSIRKGGVNGPIIVASDAEHSALVQLMLGTQEPKMPPDDSPQPSTEEIGIVRQWIEMGALGTEQFVPLKSRLNVKPIASSSVGLASITSLGRKSRDSLLIGRTNAVYEKVAQWSQPLGLDIVGKTTQIRSTPDGRFTVIASGVPGVGGQATILENTSSSLGGNAQTQLVRVIEGHNDALYAAMLSPDGKRLATAGYDRTIMLWNVADGELLRKLEGHNGAIYDLDFDASGQVLASASADETIKIWRVDDGLRLDTFGQCEAEQVTVRFDSARNRVLASGADKRVRVWKLLSFEKPSVSPLLFSTYAHEAPVSAMAMSDDGEFLATVGEDRQVKLWSADDLSPFGIVGTIEDAASGLVWGPGDQTITVSTLDGKLTTWDVSNQIRSLRSERKVAAESPTLVSPEKSKDPLRDTIQVVESAERSTLQSPMYIPTNVEVQGALTYQDTQGVHDGDWYLFPAKKNDVWIVKVDASGSPMDSLIDILKKDGSPIVRTRLQAVRESYFTFRGKDSSNSDDFRLHRWEDMELNELLYAGGEVVKLWLYPRGPDSGFKVYPGFGKRFTYFDTTATTHALNEPAWIVRELKENESPIPNGLPLFPIYYSNDDAADRLEGINSKLTFRCEADGEFLIRIRDSRGQSGDNYKYKLSLLRPNPRFQFRLETKEVSLRPNTGTEFSIAVDRFDDFDGEIQIQVDGVPEGVSLTSPLTIQAGQHKAIGRLYCSSETNTIPKEFTMSVTCSASIGSTVIEGGPGQNLIAKWNDQATMPLKVVAMDQDLTAPALQEVTIRPGQTISVKLLIERGANTGDVSFGGDDSGRNLPHGCFVDNIGLSGLLIPAGQSSREVFITAAAWVQDQSRPFHLRANVAGSPTTSSIMIRVSRD